MGKGGTSKGGRGLKETMWKEVIPEDHNRLRPRENSRKRSKIKEKGGWRKIQKRKTAAEGDSNRRRIRES